MPTFHQIVIAPAQDEIVVVRPLPTLSPESLAAFRAGLFLPERWALPVLYTIALNVVANSDDEHIGEPIQVGGVLPMSTTNASWSPAGSKSPRPSKFTPQAIEKIKEMVAQGLSREEIAELLDVTVGSLQVTCSKLGISLRRPRMYHPSYERLKPQLQLRMVEKGSRPKGKFAITMKREGDAARAVDVPLSNEAIAELGLLASVRDMGLAKMIAEILDGAVKRGLVGKILNGHDIPPKT